MEQLNRVELRGTVGTVKTQTLSGNKMTRFSLATSRAYKDKEGKAVIDTTWHSVVVWASDRIPDLDKIKIGSKVYASGRIQTRKYTDNDNVERTSYEVVASKVTVIDNNETLDYEL